MNLEARQCQCMVGLLGFLVACDHAAADIAAGGCSRATTECVIPLHPRATVLTDLRDHAVRLMKRRGDMACADVATAKATAAKAINLSLVM